MRGRFNLGPLARGMSGTSTPVAVPLDRNDPDDLRHLKSASSAAMVASVSNPSR